MEATVGLEVLNESISRIVNLSASLRVFVHRFPKIVLVNEIGTRVVGRVDIDHFDLAQISFAQDLERVEIVAFNIDVLRVDGSLGSVATDRFFADKTQRFVRWLVGYYD